MPPSTPSSFHRNQIIGRRFELIAPLGRGGMGEVWLTRDLELEVRIAVKLLHPRLAAAAGAVAFMKNECRAARRLTHPNIVRVYDFHQQDDLAFISMEWIEGPTFDRWEPPGIADPLIAVQVLGTVANALEDIHSQGLVHRDVKARNILMTPTAQPKLTDFGIVGLWRFQPGMLDIQSGGSHASMSPQQREGQPPHPADDVFAFGVLLHATLTGANPLSDLQTPAATVDTRAPESVPRAPSKVMASEDLLQLAAQMQAPARNDRPTSMAVVQKAIDAALTAAGHCTTPPDADSYPSTDTPPARAADHIAPQPYMPTTEKSASSAPQRPIIWGLALAMGAVGLMAAGIWFIGFLAQQPATTVAPATPPQPTAAARPRPEGATGAGPAPVSKTPPSSQALEVAEKSMARWLNVRNQLENARAAAWARETLEPIEARAREADAAMIDRTYARAAEAYASATTDGEALLASRDARFASAIQQGARALQAERPAEARTHFDLALRIQPDDAGARQGLAAADNLEKILALMATGQSHESEGRYDLALADYESALKINNAYVPARGAVDRLKDQVAETQYNRLVAEGLNAFYQNRLNDARGHIQSALQYRPGGHEAREALRQIDVATREQRIANLRRQGRAAENREAWDRALKAYDGVLTIDPALQFARLGAARSRERIRIDKRLRYYIDHPEVLASDRYLEEAQRLLASIQGLEPKGPRLSGQIQTLEDSIQKARSRITVTLLSDGQTEVAVLRVARLGRITRQTLELRPGTYTITGARNGYKDVRRTIRIEADQEALQVSVACKDKI